MPAFALSRLWLCAAVLLLSACNVLKDEAPPPFDQVADAMPFVRPQVQAPDTLPDAPALTEKAQRHVALRRAFFARDFNTLETQLSAAHADYVNGEDSYDALTDLGDTLNDTQLAGLDVCTDWLAAAPQSYVAHVLCGGVWSSGAMAARTQDYAAKIKPVQFALMRERLARSNALLEKAVALSPTPIEALVQLATNHFLLSDHDTAESYLQRAQALLPTHLRLHAQRAHFAQPEWGGSADAVQAVLTMAQQAGVDEDGLLYLQDTYAVRPPHFSNPGAEQGYWDKAIAEKPLFHRLYARVVYFQRMENWRALVSAATALLEAHPNEAHIYWLRGQAQERLGNLVEALQDYRHAAAFGHDAAINNLIQAHVRGGLGLAANDWSNLLPICTYGAALGSASAANCMAATFREGAKFGLPVPVDLSQSFAWHLFAARGGHFNSQYDLGWLLYTGRGPGIASEQGKRNGLFWLRRAAAQEHQFAKRKLQEAGEPEFEPVQEGRRLDGVLRLAEWLLRVVL